MLAHRLAARFAGSALAIVLLGLSGFVHAPLASEFRLITSPWPPSSFWDQAGNPAGIAVDVVEALKKRVGVDTPIEIIPWARGYLTAQKNPNVMLFTAARTQERQEAGFTFIGPVIMWSHILWSRAQGPVAATDLDDMRAMNATAAAVRGSWQADYIADAGLTLVETDDHAMGARMLLAGRVDFWLTSALQAAAVLEEIGQKPADVVPVVSVRQAPTYLMVSDGSDPETLSKWQEAFSQFQASREAVRIAEDWSARLNIELTYKPDIGFVGAAMAADGSGL
ncbi:ABC transporter substrate-binding protein [Roseibium aquae]|uniref:ABC transporter substrate-binding protein n=1 Tax=Roseibium aquae TaxID=1323746 RepID=A0A916WUQ1_9HYPH|nr:transporter substrate-binding domain-containing protein [Roseibium aquae]GGB35630.1 ABC transporter substrate-binding protein [Roseibium aquae]